MHPQNGSNLLFELTAATCLVNAVITVIFFLLYIKARMADQSAEPGRDEARYQSIHFITLFLFVVFGVLVLIQLSNRYNYVPPGGRYSTAPAQENKLFYPPAGSAIPKNRS